MTPIRNDNVKRCNTILAEIATQYPDAELLAPKLARLAEHGLCVRFHQGQREDMVRKWKGLICEEYTEDTLPSERPRSRNDASSLQASDDDEVQTLRDTIAAMQETIRDAQRRLDRLQRPTPSPAVSRVSTSSISVLDLNASRSSTVRESSPTSRTNPARSQVPQVRTPSPVRASTQTTPVRRCTRPHVRRLPVDEECAICFEGVLADTEVDELVWCKAGCGKSVHKECFEVWKGECVRAGRATTCIHCRTRWVDRCGC